MQLSVASMCEPRLLSPALPKPNQRRQTCIPKTADLKELIVNVGSGFLFCFLILLKNLSELIGISETPSVSKVTSISVPGPCYSLSRGGVLFGAVCLSLKV